MAQYGFTLVQHSGFGYAGKPGFAKGVEVRHISTAKERDLVLRAGGIVEMSGVAIDELEERVNYGDASGIYPNAKGNFSKHMIDGLRIYIPVTAIVG